MIQCRLATPLPPHGMGKFVVVSRCNVIELYANIRSDSLTLRMSDEEMEKAFHKFSKTPENDADKLRHAKLFGLHRDLVPDFNWPLFGGGFLALKDKKAWWGGESAELGLPNVNLTARCLLEAGYEAFKW